MAEAYQYINIFQVFPTSFRTFFLENINYFLLPEELKMRYD